MPPAKAQSQQSADLGIIAIPLLIVGGALAAAFGWAPGLVLFAAAMLRAWGDQPPRMGPATARSSVAAQGPQSVEDFRKLRSWQEKTAARKLGFDTLASGRPSMVSADEPTAEQKRDQLLDALGLKPFRWTWVVTVGVAALCWSLTSVTPLGMEATPLWWLPAVSALLGALTAWGWGTARRNRGAVSPEIDLSTSLFVAVAVGLVGGFAAWVGGAFMPWHLDFAQRLAASIGLTLIIVPALAWLTTSKQARDERKYRLDTDDEWWPRWHTIQKGAAHPNLRAAQRVGPFRICEWGASGGATGAGFANRALELPPVMGGIEVSLRPSGTTSFTSWEWDPQAWPDLGDLNLESDIIHAAINAAVGQARVRGTAGPMPADDAQPAWDDDSPTAMWAVPVQWPERGQVDADFGLPSDVMAATSNKFEVATQTPDGSTIFVGSASAKPAKDVADLIRWDKERRLWTKAWTELKPTKFNPPTFNPAHTQNLGGVSVRAFSARAGRPAPEYFVPLIENGLISALGADHPQWLVALGHPPTGGQQGMRDRVWFRVASGQTQLPRNPESFAGVDRTGDLYVLAAMVSRAFDDARVARPELVAVKKLTGDATSRRPGVRTPGRVGRSDQHIWMITLQLYGATYQDVKVGFDRLQRSLNTSWLRIAEDQRNPGRIFMYCGAAPTAHTTWLSKEYALEATRLDLAQAWASASVTGDGGRPPQLVSIEPLEGNDLVSRYLFDLPQGIGDDKIAKALPTIRNNLRKGWIQIERGAAAGTMAMRVADGDPMPSTVDFDPDAFEFGKPSPFASDSSGVPVRFSTEDSPHMAVLGGTGSGKSILGRVLINGRLLAGSELFIADPLKGAADYVPFAPYARVFAKPNVPDGVDLENISPADTTAMQVAAIRETEAMFEYIYREVVRRVAVNSKFGCDFRSVPSEYAYPQITVVLDEFESFLRSARTIGKYSTDPEIEQQRQANIAWNDSLRRICELIGPITREARSAGVALIVIGQALTADTLMIKGLQGVDLNGLKNNLGRILMGNPTSGMVVSALGDSAKATTEDLGDAIPPGRGRYKPSSGQFAGHARAIQVWYVGASDAARILAERLQPAEPVDLSPYLKVVEEKVPDEVTAATLFGFDYSEALTEFSEESLDLSDLDLGLDLDDSPRAGEPETVNNLEAFVENPFGFGWDDDATEPPQPISDNPPLRFNWALDESKDPSPPIDVEDLILDPSDEQRPWAPSTPFSFEWTDDELTGSDDETSRAHTPITEAQHASQSAEVTRPASVFSFDWED